MKAINGRLDMSKSYKLIGIDYGDCMELSGGICDNCGNPIKNIAIVERQDGNHYRIGLDCMQTITNMMPDDKQQAKNELNRIRKFVQGVKYSQVIAIGNNDIFAFYHYGTDTSYYYDGYGKYSKYKNIINKVDCIRIYLDMPLSNMRDIPRLLKIGTELEYIEQFKATNSIYKGG